MKQKILIPPPPFSPSQIIENANNLIDVYVNLVGRRTLIRDGLCFADVYQRVIYPRYGIAMKENAQLGFEEEGKNKILGLYDIISNSVEIDQCIGPESRDPRRTFTLWHEVGGHGVLQGEWLRERFNRARTSKTIVTTDISISPAAITRIERQANIFAAHAAAPLWLVEAVIFDVFRPTKRFIFVQPGDYWFDVYGHSLKEYVPDFNALCRSIARRIQSRFGGLSVEALGYQVEQSRWVNNRAPETPKLMRSTREDRHARLQQRLTNATESLASFQRSRTAPVSVSG